MFPKLFPEHIFEMFRGGKECCVVKEAWEMLHTVFTPS